MDTIHLTRAQYDKLIGSGFWMTFRKRVSKKWSVGGVSITGKAESIQMIRDEIEKVSQKV
jgi:hypothetical protein